jgi:hypothetical protein
MKPNKKALAILSAGHLATDINQGALPALLPFFKEALNLSYKNSWSLPLTFDKIQICNESQFYFLSVHLFRPIAEMLALKVCSYIFESLSSSHLSPICSMPHPTHLFDVGGMFKR